MCVSGWVGGCGCEWVGVSGWVFVWVGVWVGVCWCVPVGVVGVSVCGCVGVWVCSTYIVYLYLILYMYSVPNFTSLLACKYSTHVSALGHTGSSNGLYLALSSYSALPADCGSHYLGEELEGEEPEREESEGEESEGEELEGEDEDGGLAQHNSDNDGDNGVKVCGGVGGWGWEERRESRKR